MSARRPTRDIRRIIDANGNRAREAARVMEDAARFLLDDARLSKQLKTLRHELAASLTAVERSTGSPAAARDTPGDVGTTIATGSESDRATARDVAAAAAKRLGEALRSLEEHAKIVDPRLAARFEHLRYRGYELERRLIDALGPAGVQWRLCVIITEALCAHHGWYDVARAALDGGAECIQIREKGLADAELMDRVSRLVNLASRRSRTRRDAPAVIVNDRVDIALAAGADGVHLGRDDLPLAEARRQAAGRLLIGASTHNLREAKAAIDGRADYCGVGAVFSTTTKQRKPSGPAYVERFVRAHRHVPHLAIGGITPDNAARVIDAGARGIAVSSVVCAAHRPDTVVRRLLRRVPR